MEYQCVGPAGQRTSVSLEDGMRWEGILDDDEATNDDEADDDDEAEDQHNWRNQLRSEL